MPRPWVLVVFLVLIAFTSQFEWKEQGGDDEEIGDESSPGINGHLASKRQEAIKEKIILSQEKHIQKLNEVVKSLQDQLVQCRSRNSTVTGTAVPLTET